MSDIEKRARNLLADEWDKVAGGKIVAQSLREGGPLLEDLDGPAVKAIIAALTPPEGFVLVPVEPTEAMLDAEHATSEIHDEYGENRYVENPEEVWAEMLAARPEVPYA